MIKGTPGYLAPEQAQPTKQELTATTDIYSLGAILYFILTARAPLEGGEASGEGYRRRDSHREVSDDAALETVDGNNLAPLPKSRAPAMFSKWCKIVPINRQEHRRLRPLGANLGV